MGFTSIWHWLVVLAIILVLFGGRGKISSLMGDFAQGIKAFKKGMADDENTTDSKPKALSQTEAEKSIELDKSETPKS